MFSNRKAQMEMIGLVIIVILIALGMLFMAQFGMKEQKSKKVFTRSGLATSTMAALMSTTIYDPECSDQYGGNSFPEVQNDLLEDCAANYHEVPSGYSLYHCSGQHSCVYLNETLIPELLNKSLGGLGRRYEFHSVLCVGGMAVGEECAGGTKVELLSAISSQGDCQKRVGDSSKDYPLNTEMGMVVSWLYVCE